MTVKAVLFDCWGTLIAYRTRGAGFVGKRFLELCDNPRHLTGDVIEEAWGTLMREYYGGRHPFETPAEAFLNYLTTSLGLVPKVSLRELVEGTIGAQYLQEKIPGVEDMLEFLKANDIPCAVASNTIYSSEQTERYISECLSTDYFRFVLASADVGVCKPSPRFFQLACTKLGVRPEECAYIGDTFEKDVRGAYLSMFALPIWLTVEAREIDGNVADRDDVFYREAPTYKDAIQIIKENM